MDRFKLMETYTVVVKLGSYTRAAKELGVTRAMVSKRMIELEAMLGVKLLNRGGKTLSVTATGADYFESCVNLLDDLRGIEEGLVEKRNSTRGELKIHCAKTFGEIVLAPLVGDFCALYPDISVHIALRDMTENLDDVITEGFDMAIRTRAIADSTLVARAIVGMPRVLVATPGYLARNGTPAVPDDLIGHNCLNPDGSAEYVWTFKGPGGRRSVRVSGTPRANSATIIRQASLKGLGIAISSEYLVAEDIKKGDLRQVLADYAIPERKLYVFYQRDRYQPLRAKLFIDYLTRRMKDMFRPEKVAVPA